MADISKVILPNGDEYDLKDSYIREVVENHHISKTGSGHIVNFDDLADDVPFQNVTVELNPIQDLRGMDYPYVAGESTNLIPDTTDTSNGYVNNCVIYEDGVTHSDAAAYISEYFPVIGGETYVLGQLIANLNLSAICFYDSEKTYISGVAFATLLSQTVVVPQNAAYARCSQRKWEALSKQAKNIAHFQLGTSVTKCMHYSNICPIEGRTSVDIFKHSKNILIDTPEYFRTNYPTSSTLFDDGSIKVTSTCVAGFVCPVEPSTKYYASFYKNAGFTIYIYVYMYENFPTGTSVPTTGANYLTYNRTQSSSTSSQVYVNRSFTTTADTHYVIVAVSRSNAVNGNLILSDFQLELGTARTEYEKAANNTGKFTLDLGRTVYGGSVNTSAGEITEEWGMIDSYNGEELPGEWISDRDQYVENTSPSIGAQVLYKLTASETYTSNMLTIPSHEGFNSLRSNEDEDISVDYEYVSGFPYNLFFNRNPINADTVNGHTVDIDVPEDAVFTDTTYDAATIAPGNVASTSALGTSVKYAREDHTHGINLATGDSDGQVKIAGTNVDVKGLKALAYRDSLTKTDVGLDKVDNVRLTGIVPVIGTQTAATASWTGNIDIPALYDGLTIAYYLPYAGVSSTNVTLNLTLSTGATTGAVNVYYTAETRATTHYGAGSTILLTYWGAGSVSVSGTATTIPKWTRADYTVSNTNTIGEYGGALCAGPNGMARYSLVSKVPAYATGETSGYVAGQALDRWESFVLTSSTATTKSKNTSGFIIDAPVLYQNGGTYAAGASCAYTASWISGYNLDTRYTFNVSSTWTLAARPIFIVGTISNGLFYLATQWWSDKYPATNDGLYYKFIGITADKYRFVLTPIQPIYYYNNGLKVYSTVDAATVNGHTVYKDVPSNAVFTDTTYSIATTTTNGLMSSTDKSKIDSINASYNSSTETITINL